jgi:ABC-type lipoprotein export system ATPase subunit
MVGLKSKHQGIYVNNHEVNSKSKSGLARIRNEAVGFVFQDLSLIESFKRLNIQPLISY